MHSIVVGAATRTTRPAHGCVQMPLASHSARIYCFILRYKLTQYNSIGRKFGLPQGKCATCNLHSVHPPPEKRARFSVKHAPHFYFPGTLVLPSMRLGCQNCPQTKISSNNPAPLSVVCGLSFNIDRTRRTEPVSCSILEPLHAHHRSLLEPLREGSHHLLLSVEQTKLGLLGRSSERRS